VGAIRRRVGYRRRAGPQVRMRDTTGGRSRPGQGSGPRLEQKVGTFRRPLHRLLLGEALTEQRIDQRLDEGGGDRLAGPPAAGVVRDEVPVPPEVVLEAVHRPRQGGELRVAAREMPHAPFQQPEPLEGALDFPVPQVPLGVIERYLQLGGVFRVQASQPVEELAQAGQLHRQVEPVEQVLRMGAQVALQLAEALLTVREEHELLVVPQALPPEHLGQMPPRLRVVARDEAEALGWPVCRDRRANNRHEVGLLVLPMPQVAAVDADRNRRRGRGQARGRVPAWPASEKRGSGPSSASQRRATRSV
jgi:hypothetical protein